MSQPPAARWSWTVVGALAACVLASLGAQSAPAAMISAGLSSTTYAAEWYSPWSGVGVQSSSNGVVSGDGIAAHSSASVSPGTGSTTANAAAVYGGLGISLGQNGLYSALAGQQIKSQSEAYASFRDDNVVVSEDGKGAGDLGMFTANYLVDSSFLGEIAAAITNPASSFEIIIAYRIEVLIGDLRPGFDAHDVVYEGQWSIDASSGAVEEMAAVMVDDAEIAFEYGAPLTIAAAVYSSMYLVGTGPVTADVEAALALGPTFQWLGVTDLPGPADLESDNNMDWTGAVDVPAGGPIGLLMVAGMMTFNRRRSATGR